MDEEATDGGGLFAQAGERAVKRLGLVHWIRALRATVLPICGGGLLAILVLRYAGVRWPDWLAAVALLALWFGLATVWARLSKPTRFSALAAWDESAGRNEALASAEFFEARGAPTEGEKLHLLRSEKILREAKANLKKDLPLPRMTWQWALPVAVLVFSLSPLLKPQLGADQRALSEEARELAREEAGVLLRELDELEEAKGLTADEEKQYEQVLEKARDMAAEELEKAGDKSTRDLLEKLEERARAAEKLAKELGSDDDRWASEAMLAEMRKHADLADLADAVEDKSAARGADEAREVRDTLKSDAITMEVEGRVRRALDQTVEKADEEDLKKPVGKHLRTAARRMGAKQREDASAEFEKLAQEFDRKGQRERAKQQMERLAKRLRNTGSKIAGKNMAGMQKLAGNHAKGLKPQKMPLGFQNNPNLQKLGKSNAMRMQDLPMMKMPEGMKMGEGNGKGKPLAMAPVPGMKPGKVPEMIVPGMGKQPGPAAGVIPIPGMAPGPGGPMAGGQEPGQASAALGGGGKTEAAAAGKNSTVAATINSDGEVAMRAVEGEVRGEAATREAGSERVDFVNAQEEALDEATLPSSRRAHVRRYFHLLREQFEAGGGSE